VGDQLNWSEHRRRLFPAHRVDELERQRSPFIIVLDVQLPTASNSNEEDVARVVSSSHNERFEWHQLSAKSGCGLFSCQLSDIDRIAFQYTYMLIE